MASSRNPPSADPAAAARQAIEALRPGVRRVAVGLSGGADSVVLLHLLRTITDEAGLRLSAIHVNHGLSPDARRWERFCATLCRRLGVPLAVRRVRVRRSGEGLEAAARRARRAAFDALAVDAIALAHHLDDQAETVLHNLLRGAGLRGASGMPASGRFGSKLVVRPLLAVPRAAILACAQREGLAWIEDESNADTTLTRNWIRHELAPVLARRFPRWREALARAAGHFARRDARGTELLREFLREQGLRAPSEAKLADMLRQLSGARPGARPAIAHDGALLRVHRGTVHIAREAQESAFEATTWQGEPRLKLAALGGELRFRRGAGGIDPASIPREGLTVDLRRGGARLRTNARRPSRTLKNLFQEAGVPEWERRRLPMLYRDRALVWVPGLGVDAAFAAPAGRRGWLPEWRPD